MDNKGEKQKNALFSKKNAEKFVQFKIMYYLCTRNRENDLL